MRALLLPLLLLLGCATSVVAAERPEQFAYAVPIEIDAAHALQRLEIPQSVYEGTARGDLGDLRVFNSAGERVPYAFMPRAAPGAAAAPPRALNLFPLYSAHGAAAGTLEIRAQRTADGTVVHVSSADAETHARAHTGGGSGRVLVGYLVDASGLTQPLETLELHWRETGDFSGSLRVDASDDLAHWTTLAEAAPLVSLHFAGQRLERRSVELRSRGYKYLRLSWPANQPPLRLTLLRGQPRALQLEPERRWKAVRGSAGEKLGEYLFDLGGRLPVDRLRLDLPQPNTLVSVQVLARNRGDQPWQTIASGVFYRLRRGGQDIISPDLRVAGGGWRYWLLRVDQKGGGIGTGEPGLQAGWVPQQLVFVARGDPPFQLAYGQAPAQPTAYPIETIVPGWRSDQALQAALAQTGEQRDLAGASALRPPRDTKTWILWGSLILAVGVLAWMAWQLSRQMGRQESGVRGQESENH